jgi:hypothetical protein
MDLLVLADEKGIVDMTIEAVARRTNVPLEIVSSGIAALLKPDPNSRSQEEEGRRIVPLDERRSWGWLIVNYERYRNTKSKEDKRLYDQSRYKQTKVKKSEQNGKSEIPLSSSENGEFTHAYASASASALSSSKFDDDDKNKLDGWVGLHSDFRAATGKAMTSKDERWLRENMETRGITPEELLKLSRDNTAFRTPMAGLKWLVKNFQSKNKSKDDLENQLRSQNGFHQVKERPRCDVCSNTGRLAQGGYCECGMGKDLQRVERRVRPIVAEPPHPGVRIS